jgi:hypothetical protein
MILFSVQSGRGAAWLARYLGVVEVASSNLVAPTSYNPDMLKMRSVRIRNTAQILHKKRERCILLVE